MQNDHKDTQRDKIWLQKTQNDHKGLKTATEISTVVVFSCSYVGGVEGLAVNGL